MNETAVSDKRTAILNTTLTLIAKRGFHGTPMSLVANRSGVSTGIIYHYFAGKDDLIHALYRHVKQELGAALLVGMEGVPPSAAHFQQLWFNAFHYYAAHPDATLFLEQYENSPYQQPHEDFLADAEFVALSQLLHDYQATGLLKDLPYTVLHELSFGVALKIAKLHLSGLLPLDDTTLTAVATACWQAVSA